MKKILAAFVGSMALASAPLALAADATKELKMAYDADPVTLDIHEQLSGGILQLSHMTFDPLLRWTKDLGFEPRLAESWERVDDKTMRFKLREGVKFHSGNELTTADVKFTFERLKESQDFKAIFKPFSAINVIDDYTFELVTSEPYPLLLNTATYIFPLDSEFYSGQTEDGKDKDAILKHGNSFASENLSGRRNSRTGGPGRTVHDLAGKHPGWRSDHQQRAKSGQPDARPAATSNLNETLDGRGWTEAAGTRKIAHSKLTSTRYFECARSSAG